MNYQELDQYMRSPKAQEETTVQPYALRSVSGPKAPVNVLAQQLFSNVQTKTSIALSPHLRGVHVSPHDHDFYEVMYVYAGSVTHEIAGEQVVLGPSDVLMLAPGTCHSVCPCGKNDLAVNFIIPKGYFIPERLNALSRLSELSRFLCGSEPDCGYLVWQGDKNQRISLYAQELICELLQPDRYTAKIIDSLVIMLFSTLERTSPGGYEIMSKKQMNISGDIDHIIDYIEQNYADVSLSKLANRFGYSENYISKAIKEKTGLSFKDFRHHQCLVQSALLLAGTDMSVRQIADAVGMSNMSFFYNLFKRGYGLTPAEYRLQATGEEKTE